MSIFKYLAGGAVEGLGQGIADIGAQEQRAAEAEKARRERAAEMEREIRLRAEVSGTRGGGRGGAMGSAPQTEEQIARVLREQGMGSMAAAEQAARIARGTDPGESVPMSPSRFGSADRQAEAVGGPSSQFVPKYEQGQAAAMAEDARIALRRAITAPGSSDDVAKAEQTEVVTGALKKYRDTGDAQSGRTVALGTKGVVKNEDGDVVTGEPGKGTTAAAKVARDSASANKDNAQASKTKAEEGMAVKDADVNRANRAVVEARKPFDARIAKVEADMTLADDVKAQRIAAINAEAENSPEVKRAVAEADGVKSRRDARVEPKAEKAPADKKYPEAPRDPAQRKTGTVYETPKGPLKWMGNGWAKV